MERLSSKGLERLARLRRQQNSLGLEARPIGVVPEQRVSDMGQMDTDLMGPPCFEAAGEKARDRPAIDSQVGLEPLPVGYRLAAANTDRLLVTCLGMAVERGIDRALGPLWCAPDEGEIRAFQRA